MLPCGPSPSCVRQPCPMPGEDVSDNSKLAERARHPLATQDSCDTDKKTDKKEEILKDHKAQKKNMGKSRSNHLQRLVARVITNMFHISVGPCFSCLPSLSYFRPPWYSFYSSRCPPCLYPLCRVSFHCSCAPPLPPFCWEPPAADSRNCLQVLTCASSSCHFPINRLAASRIPQYHFLAFLVQWTTARSQLQTPRGSVRLILLWLGTP